MFLLFICVYAQVKCVRCPTHELWRGSDRDRAQLATAGLHPEEVRHFQSDVRIQQGKSAALVKGAQHGRPKVDFFPLGFFHIKAKAVFFFDLLPLTQHTDRKQCNRLEATSLSLSL